MRLLHGTVASVLASFQKNLKDLEVIAEVKARDAETIRPQQIKSNNAPHAHPRFRRGHYRDRVTSQLMVAA